MSHSFVLNGGYYIKYPQSCWDSSGLFINDWVYLSDLENAITTLRLQSKFKEFDRCGGVLG